MSAAFGIYLGCTTACVAVCRDGKRHVIANELGDRVTPACVGFFGNDVSVGLSAKQNFQKNASNTIMNVKKILGMNFNEDASEIEKFISKSSVKVLRTNNQPIFQVTTNEKVTQFQPIEIAGLIFKNLLETAKSQNCQLKTNEAVITVPAYFNVSQRNAVRKAAESVGFRVLRIINECTSPLLAYNIGQDDPNLSCNVLVLRVGGQSADVSIVKVISGMYQVVAHEHNDTLAGAAVDNGLVDFLVTEFKRQSRLDCSKNERALSKLRLAAETCKHALSSQSSSNCSVESLFEGMDFSCVISRSRLDAISSSFVQSCLRFVEQFVNDKAGLKLEEINKVVICGGVTKMAQLQQKLQDLLPSSEFLNSITPDEVIAVGASQQAAVLSGRDADESELFSQNCNLPCLSSDILLEVVGGDKELLFQRGTPIPFRRQLVFPVSSGQTGALFQLFQGTSQHGVKSLMKIVIKDQVDEGRMNVVFHFKHDGSLHVTCSDSSGRNLADVTAETLSDLPSSPYKATTRISTNAESIS